MARDVSGPLSWANSEAANSAKTLVDPDTSHSPGAAIVHVHNPGASALTVKGLLRWTGADAVVRDSELVSFAVLAGATKAQRVEGLGMGQTVIRVSNDTVIGAAGAFTAQVRVEFL